MTYYGIGWSDDRIIYITNGKRKAQDYAIQYFKKEKKNLDADGVYDLNIYKQTKDKYGRISYGYIGTVTRTVRPVGYYYTEKDNLTPLIQSRVKRK